MKRPAHYWDFYKLRYQVKDSTAIVYHDSIGYLWAMSDDVWRVLHYNLG